MKSKIDIKGLNSTLIDLEKIIGKRRLRSIVDKALIDGAKVIESYLKRNFQDFKDTGQSIAEITVSKPETLNGKRTIRIHWKGPENRWRIIHMNEYGTVKNPNPRGKGAIERALRAGREQYFRTIEQEISRALR